jgi:hypothetical protein
MQARCNFYKAIQSNMNIGKNDLKENEGNRETFNRYISSIRVQPEIRLDWDGKRLEIENPAVAAAGP